MTTPREAGFFMPAEWAPHVVRPARVLLDAARRLLPDAAVLPIGHQ